MRRSKPAKRNKSQFMAVAGQKQPVRSTLHSNGFLSSNKSFLTTVEEIVVADPFILSRKIKRSILNGIDILRFGSFTESDVKTLLIDLREVAKYMVKSVKHETNDFTILTSEFIEVCDFIAHASRDRGLVEKIVRAHVDKLHTHLDMRPDDFSKIPVSGVLKANKFVLALAGIASFALGNLDPKTGPTKVQELQERQSEIALCIMSLLQDSVIQLKEGAGFGVLQLMPYEGKYRIYCRVLNSKIEQEAKARTGGSGTLVLGFPVMISDMECVDPIILHCNHTAFPQPIFETYRDENLLMQLRIMEA